jgi:hypothetical protein
MRTIFMTMAAIGALAVGTPAAAQHMGGNVQARVYQLQTELHAGIRNGSISTRESMPLRQQLRRLTRLERIYSSNGLTGRERGELMQGISQLRQQIRIAERSGNGRYGRGDGNDGRWGDRDDRRDDRWSGRGDDDGRDGRWDNDDDDDGRDGRWDNDDDRDGVLRVGQRASGGLSALPAGLRTQFRDGNGSYFRYGGGNVYQIDARTNLILRVYAARR